MSNDVTLIQQILSSDEVAFTTLVRRYQGMVFSLAYHMEKNTMVSTKENMVVNMAIEENMSENTAASMEIKVNTEVIEKSSLRV